MSEHRLQDQLESLEALLSDPEAPLAPEERDSLQQLATNIKARMIAMEADELPMEDPSLVDGVNLMVEQLSARHPTTATTLRSIMQTLANMGI